MKSSSSVPAALANGIAPTQDRGLRASLFESLVEGAAPGVIVHDQHRVLYVNPAAIRMFRYGSAEEMLALSSGIRLIAPEDRHLAIQHWENLDLPPAPARHHELRCLRRDGTHFSADLLQSAIDWESRRAALFHIVEAAPGRGAQSSPLPNERLLQAIFDTLPLHLFVKDRERRYVMVNAAFLNFLGLTLEQCLGKRIGEIAGRPQSHVDQADRDDLLTLARAEQIEVMDQELIDGQGETRWVTGVKLPLRDEQGQVVGILGVTEDITDRLATLQHLRNSRGLMRTVLDTIPHPFYLKDLSGRILMANAALAQVWRLPNDEVIGKAVHEFTHLDTMPQEETDAILRSDARVAAGETVTIEIERGDASGQRIFRCVKAPVRESGGQITGILTLARDITEKRKAELRRAELEAQLQHTQKMELIGQLAAGVAHDFNNLLTPILGHAELLLLRRRGNDPDRAALDVILQATRRASDLNRQLLAFGRKQVLETRVLSLDAEVAGMLQMIERVLGSRIRVVFDGSEPPGRVRADVSQLHQVLMNLVVNARDAMPGGGTLTIATRRIFLDADYAARQPGVAPGRYLRLSVADTGSGIDPATLERIFEPFFTTKEPGKGTGLGLSIVYGIVQQHHGHLRVESTVGQGARFDVFLPEVSAEAEPREEEAGIPPASRGSEPILVVDPEGWCRDMMQRVLDNLGYSVAVAADADEALDSAARLGPSLRLLIADMHLSKMSGVELYRRLTSSHGTLKVLYVTGNTQPPSGETRSGKGYLPLLEKPFPILKLALKVREILDS